jgi:hypothetical protein
MLDEIRAARQTHENLRASSPARATLGPKSKQYRLVKAVLDQVWEAADRPGAMAPTADIRRAVARLTTDAEYHAGLSDAEGFRDPAEAMAQYDMLERAFAGTT